MLRANILLLFAAFFTVSSCQIGRSCSDFDSLKSKMPVSICNAHEVSGDGFLLTENGEQLIVIERDSRSALRLVLSDGDKHASCFSERESVPVTYLGIYQQKSGYAQITLDVLFSRDEAGKMQACE